MIKSFYGSLAIQNIKKNGKHYIPYMLTCIFSIMIFYIMMAIVNDPQIGNMMGGASLTSMLAFGCFVIGFFSAIFLFYTNSFLIKNRKKELALYNILGMSKIHIGKVLFLETVFTSILSIIIGLISGVVFGKLVYLLLLKILDVDIAFSYAFSLSSAVISAIVFGGIFLAVLVCNLARLSLSNPIELLSGGQSGEKEPKTKWLLVLIGLGTMGAGYYLALSVESPLQAFAIFFVAVILVIIGTYCLFTAGSIALLKLLRKNKSFYYKTEHFTSVSGMIYRMKRNAAGLASICILSTMVLVTVSTTVSMQTGLGDVISGTFPNDVQMKGFGTINLKEQKEVYQTALDKLEKHKLKPSGVISYGFKDTMAIQNENRITPAGNVSMSKNILEITLVSMEDSVFPVPKVELGHKDVLMASNQGTFDYDQVQLGDQIFDVVKNSKFKINTAPPTGAIGETMFIFVKNEDVLNSIMASDYGQYFSNGYFLGIDIDYGSKADVQAYCKDVGSKYTNMRVDEKESASRDFYSVFSGLFFIGIFLGLLFLIATVLIIYYKQISEGHEDSQRYQIMQKVGMSLSEVKKSIRSQILTVFFIPLIVAVVHVAVAFHMMNQLLVAMQLTNTMLTLACTGITIFIFVVFYIAVYSVTAREYYKLVK